MVQQNAGRTLWSDLHYSELDQGKPEPRVVLSVQRALSDASGQVLGVLRVALLTTDLDAISRLKVDPADPNDPHRIALLAFHTHTRAEEHAVILVRDLDPIEITAEPGDALLERRAPRRQSIRRHRHHRLPEPHDQRDALVSEGGRPARQAAGTAALQGLTPLCLCR